MPLENIPPETERVQNQSNMGPWKHRVDKPLNFKWTKDSVRMLAAYVFYNEKENEKKNFVQKVQNLNTTPDIWRSRNPTIFGRCLISKCLGISHLIHSTSMLVMPKKITTSTTVSLFNFIWCKKQDTIKRQILY